MITTKRYFTVFMSNDTQRSIEAVNVTSAFIRVLSFNLVRELNVDIDYIIDEQNGLVHHTFDWIVSYRDEQRITYVQPEHLVYTEEDILNYLEEFSKYVGMSSIAPHTWWKGIGSKKKTYGKHEERT